MKTEPRILIAEDMENTRRRLQQLFSSPPEEFQQAYAAKGFEVETATTGTEAMDRLERAASSGLPYDVLLLDLGLPPEAGANEDPQVGLDILEWLHRQREQGEAPACLTTVVESVHTEVPTFLKMIRLGLAHFIPKPFSRSCEEVYRTVARATAAGLERGWHRQRMRGLRSLVDPTMSKLHAHAQAQVADQVAKVTADGIGDILQGLERLGALLSDRYQLDPGEDADDPVCAALKSVRQAALDTSRRCAVEREALTPDTGEVAEVRIDDLVREVLNWLRPGILFKHLAIDGPGDTDETVRTFRDEMRMILEELLSGAIESSKPASGLSIAVSRDSDGQAVRLVVRDSAEPLSAEVVQRINKAEPFKPTADRAWGLSLAQRVARSIGTRITVEPRKNGNTCTLHVPVIADE